MRANSGVVMSTKKKFCIHYIELFKICLGISVEKKDLGFKNVGILKNERGGIIGWGNSWWIVWKMEITVI